MKRFVMLVLAFIVGLTVLSAVPANAEKLQGCKGRWRIQSESRFETGRVTWAFPDRRPDTGFAGGRQALTYFYCPYRGGAKRIAPAFIQHGWRNVDRDMPFTGMGNRAWLYDDRGRNWNMSPWQDVADDDDRNFRYRFFDAPGVGSNRPGRLIWMKVKNEPRWRAQMYIHLRHGSDDWFDYLTPSGGTVKHVDIKHPSYRGDWNRPGDSNPPYYEVARLAAARS